MRRRPEAGASTLPLSRTWTAGGGGTFPHLLGVSKPVTPVGSPHRGAFELGFTS